MHIYIYTRICTGRATAGPRLGLIWASAHPDPAPRRCLHLAQVGPARRPGCGPSIAVCPLAPEVKKVRRGGRWRWPLRPSSLPLARSVSGLQLSWGLGWARRVLAAVCSPGGAPGQPAGSGGGAGAAGASGQAAGAAEPPGRREPRRCRRRAEEGGEREAAEGLRVLAASAPAARATPARALLVRGVHGVVVGAARAGGAPAAVAALVGLQPTTAEQAPAPQAEAAAGSGRHASPGAWGGRGQPQGTPGTVTQGQAVLQRGLQAPR